MKCPNCRKKLTVDHIRANPECSAHLQSLMGIFNLSKRKTVTRAGGRPKKAPEGK